MTWFIAVFFVILISILPLGVMWLYEGIFRWNINWGAEVYQCSYFKLRFRRKNANILHFNFKQIESELINKLNQKAEFRDKDLIDNIQCILTTNLKSSHGVAGIGSATLTPYFWWKNWSYVYFIAIDAVLVKERNLSSKDIAGLILHEYFHHYLHKYTGDGDGNHSSVYWEVFNR